MKLLLLPLLALAGPALAQAPTFAAQATFATGANPQNVAVADVNGDGRPDLLVANGTSTVSVLLNTTATSAATASFSTQAVFNVGNNPYSVAAADVNGDGKPDVLVANGLSNSVSVLLNTTAAGAPIASFAAQATFTTSPRPYSVAAADVNGDGKPDLVTANMLGNSVSVLLNTTAVGAATASFSPQTILNTGGGPTSVAAADVNGDGRPDLLVAHHSLLLATSSGYTVGVLLNTTAAGATTASFAAQTTFAVGNNPFTVAAADVDGDGRPDLLVANSSSGTVGVLLNTTAAGATTASFAAQTAFTAGNVPQGMAAADVNGDGKPDMLAANFNSNSVSVLLNTTAVGATTPSFAAQVSFATGTWPQGIVAADVNSDGKPDLITSNYSTNNVSVLLNTTPPPVLVPTLTALSPTSGPVGTVVTLTGTNLTGPTGVNFNGVAAATFAATSATTATATVPAGATTGPVTLTTAAGTATGPAFTVTLPLTVPDVDTSLPPTVLSTSATLGGVVNSDGGSPVTERGIVYTPGAAPPPTIANLKVPMGTGLGSFAGTIGGLLPNRAYTARAYATNAVGTGYGSLVMTFVTLQGLATAAPQAAGVALFPNPAHLAATLTTTSLPAATTQLTATLLNPLGQVVRRLTVPATTGAATATVPTTGLAPGLYLLRLATLDAQGAALGALPVQRLSVE
ncbi:MAG: FG-GAP-like repeat-containing protein [Janthinobacterium lividum]